MRRLFFTVCCLVCVLCSYAQSTTRISAATNVQNKSATYNVPAGFFVNNGTYTDTTTPGAFNAAGGVAFSGSGTTKVYNLNLNAGASDMSAASVSVYKTATIASGASLNAGSGNLNLRTDLPGHIDANLVNNGALTGTVTGLVTFATATTGGCPSYASTLSINVSGTSMRYQWQTSPDNSTYTPIAGATNATYAATVSTTLYYRCALSASNTAYTQNTPAKLLSAGVPPTVVGTGVSYCSGASGSISATGATTYTWTPATGLSATTGANVTSSGLTANMTYTVTGTTGTCSASVPVTVSINPLPTPGTISSTATVCISATVSSSASGASGGVWSSAAPAVGTIDAATGTFAGLTAGTALVSYSVTNGCGTVAATKTYTVNAAPAAGIINGTAAVCVNGSTNLTSTGTAGGNWSSTNTATGTISATGTFTGIAAGTTTISYAVTSTCGTTAAMRDVTVNARPAISAIGNNGPICAGAALSLNSTAAGGAGALVYAWSGPNAFTSTNANTGIATATTAASGTYTLTVADANGCTATGINTTAAVVNSLPNTISVGSNSPVCAGSTLNLTNNTTGGTAPLLYAWSGPGSFSSTAANPALNLVTATAGGIYTLAVTDANGCTATGGHTTLVSVNGRPVVSSIGNNGPVCSGSNLTFSSSAGGAQSPYAYSWSGPNTFSSTAQNPVISSATTAATGAYTLNVTDANGCTSASSSTTSAVVNQRPVIASIGNSGPVCAGAALSFNSSASGGTGSLSYAWNGPLAYSSTAANPAIGSAVTGNTGTYTLTVTDGVGCRATGTNITAAVVNSRPVLSGPANNGPICAGSTLSLSSSASGGTAPLTFLWTGPNSYSSTAANSSVAGATTAASGIYTVIVTDANGCTPVATNTTSATVRATPVIASIGNNGPICAGFNLNLSSTASGGTGTLSYTWSGPASYSASGASPSISGATPAATGNYVLTVSDVNNCTATGNTAAVVNAIPVLSSISNNGPVCAGATLNLNSSASGGTAPLSYVWSGPNSFTSTNSSASITGASTLATGTYTLVVSDANGCNPTAANTTAAVVNPGPEPITGSSAVCEGLTTPLSNTTAAGTWSSSNSGVATVDASGIVSGNVQGVAVISYILASGCYATKEITVSPMPGAITGPASICAGANITLGNSLSGGTWSSSNTSVATADITTGVITGLAAGTATISYTSDRGCVVTTAVPVSNMISAIAGGTGTCTGLFLTLSDATPGGVWSTSNPAVVAVNSAGVVQALSGGTAFITYTVGACYRAQPMTISTAPPDISGDLSLCIGNTSALSNVITGGTWISASAFIASVSASGGVVTGVASGTVNITYALSATCRTSVTVTVDPSPVVTGPSLICQGATVAFSSTSPGGSWLSGNPAIAMVDASGNVTGVSTGNTTLTYTVGSGCSRVVNIAVSPLPAAISGAASICVGAVTVYTDATPGGTLWSSSNTSVATIGSASGLVTGIGVGTAVITYTINTGCVSTKVISINALPDVVTGNPAVCVGGTTTLASAPAGGTWSSASTAIATVSATGVVTGATPGAATISYSQGVGCNRTQVVTVSAAPPVITGTTTICLGSTSNLTNSVSGGTWSSSDATVANVNLTTGAVAGVGTGIATITYTAATGCIRTTTVTVNTAPAITGTTSVCAGTNTNLANATGGGVWSSSNTAVATVNSASGAVTTIAPGTATITYTLSAGCSVSTILTANAAPAAITGTMNVNVAGTTTLSNTVAGGAWTSSDTSLATVDLVTGVVTGVASGNLVVTYTIGSCAKTTAVTVNPEPDAIVGSPTVCVGLSINLSNPQIGLSWTSSNPGVATIGSSSGVVTGVTPGTTIITFTALSGAIATRVMTVNPQPSAITGAAAVCVGATVTFTNPDAGGVWTSNNTPVAAVSGSTGVVSGMSSGVAVITYSLAGCIAVKGILVNPLPNSISGTATICTGSTGTLADVTPGGTWSSNTLSVATVNASGVVSGLTAGTSVISYTLASGCAQTKEVTVNVMPSITGNTTACIGSTTSLSNPGGGNWTSSNVSVATIGAGTGVVTGVTAGTSSITYTLTAGCKTSTVVTVVAGPANITGATSVCVNAAVTLANVTPSGTWSSNNTGLATVGAATGMVTGVAAGASQITYTIANGCFKTYNVTIKAIPVPISGNPAVCVGGVTMMSDPTPTGASWVSSNTGVATIAGSGAVTGLTPGTTTITYNLTSGCYATTDVTVSVATSAGTVTGPATVGIAASSVTPVLYSNAVAGGLWTSSNTARATIGSASGLVRGLSAGAVTLTYTALTGCKATLPITITSPRAGGNHADVAITDMMQLFPNPTSGSFTVNAVGDGILKVYTLEGKEVIRYAISEGNNLLQLPHGLAAGVYMCSYTNDKGETQLVRLVYQP